MAATQSDGGGGNATTSAGITVQAAFAWGVLFVVFIAMTDVPQLAEVGAGLAWLLFVSILFKYGPAAFQTITNVNVAKVEAKLERDTAYP